MNAEKAPVAEEAAPSFATTPSAGQAHSSARWGDLWVRTVSAAVLIPAVLLDVWQGGVWFELFMAFLGVLVAHEWTVIAHERSSAQFALHAGAGMGAAFLPIEIGFPSTVLFIAVLAALSIAAASYSGRKLTLWTMAGVAYVGAPVLSLVLLRHSPEWGIHALMWLMLVVWATDTCAYFAGRMMGGPKLAPKLSPKKTWSGLLGGMAGAAAVSIAYTVFALPGLHGVGALAAAGAALALVAQAGDIFESAFKRQYGVKDSGKLIPGHGGVLDRVDGLLAAGVAAALLAFWGGGSSLAHGLFNW